MTMTPPKVPTNATEAAILARCMSPLVIHVLMLVGSSQHCKGGAIPKVHYRSDEALLIAFGAWYSVVAVVSNTACVARASGPSLTMY